MKSVLKIGMAVLLICIMIVSMSACGAKVSVIVLDGTQTTQVETKTGKTIAAVLEEAGITLGDKDETEPAADAKLTKDVAQITVKRYASVTVVKGDDKKEVELVGATVEDAIKASGFALSDKESPDVDPQSFLTDGMTITIAKAMSVTVVHDGKTETFTTKAQTVKALLEEQGLTLDEDDGMSAKMEDKLKDGAKITIVRVEFKKETKTETIPYSTTKQYDSSLASGQTKVKQQGQDGEKEVTYTVKYADGKMVKAKPVSEKITKNPVDEVVLVGTAGGSSESGGRTIVSKTPTYNCDGSGHGYYTIVYSDGTTEYEEF